MNAQTITIWTFVNVAAIILGIVFQIQFICVWNSNCLRVEEWAKKTLESLKKSTTTDGQAHNNVFASKKVRWWQWIFNRGGFTFISIPAIIAVCIMVYSLAMDPKANVKALDLLAHPLVQVYIWMLWIVSILVYSNKILGHVNQCIDSRKTPPSRRGKINGGSGKTSVAKKEDTKPESPFTLNNIQYFWPRCFCGLVGVVRGV